MDVPCKEMLDAWFQHQPRVIALPELGGIGASMDFKELVTIVLAGNDEVPDLLGGVGQTSKFFLQFGPERVCDRIVKAVDACGACRSIFLAVPETCLEVYSFSTRLPLHMVAQGERRTESMLNALNDAKRLGDYAPGDYVLVMTGDLALLTTSSLGRFIRACEEVGEADCYMGMIPLDAVDEELREGYAIEHMPFRGEACLHADVYLLRPDSLTEEGRNRFEEIIRIRRLEQGSLRHVVKVAVVLLKTVGVQAIPAFITIMYALGRDLKGGEAPSRQALDRIERVALRLIENRFGPRLQLVSLREPALALGFDDPGQLELLRAYGDRGAGRKLGASAH